MVSFHSSDGGDDGPLEEVEAGVAEVARLWSASYWVGDQTICHIQSRKCFCFTLDV
jgi:hypothetical protein